MAITTTVSRNLEINSPNDLVLVHAVQGESYSRQVIANLKQNGAAYTIPSEAIALIRYRRPDGKVGFYDYVGSNRIVNISSDRHSVTFTLDPEMCSVPGRVFAHVDLYSSTTGDRLSAFYFEVDVEKAATDPEIYRESNVTGVYDLVKEIIGSVYTPSATPQEGAIIDNTLSVPGAVGDAKAMGDVVLVQPNQPSASIVSNKLWVDSDTLDEGTEVPDMDDIVSEFSTTKTYHSGDYANHEGHIYKYIAETASSGAWDNSKWEQVVICNEVSDLKSALYVDREGTLLPFIELSTSQFSGLSLINEMPPNSVAYPANGADIKTHMNSSWENYDKIVDITQYKVFSEHITSNSMARRITIESIADRASVIYIFNNSGEVTFSTYLNKNYLRDSYSNESIGTILKLDRANTEVDARGHYTGSLSDARELPKNSWATMAGSSSSILGTEFTWELVGNKTYVISKQQLSSSNAYSCRYELYMMGYPVQYVGYTTTSTDAIHWASVSELVYSDNFKDEHIQDFMLYVPDSFASRWILASANDGVTLDDHTSWLHVDEYIRVIPGRTYYVSNNPYVVSGAGDTFFCYDINKKFLRQFRGNNTTYIQEYPYKLPDGYVSYNSASSSNTKYVHLYALQVPEDTYFMRFNINSSYSYCWTLCTKPMLGVQGCGSWIISKNDPMLQMLSSRNLCVIGPSTTMIDRIKPSTAGDFNQYIMGWQEYMIPYWNTVQSYGYSGASWGDSFVQGSTGYSIHKMICGDTDLGITPVDLTCYDDFIITNSSNGINSAGYEVGTWDKSDPEFSTDTHMGALRDTIDYIYAQNGAARVWVCDMVNYEGKSQEEKRKAICDATRDMCEDLGIQLLDFQNAGFNMYTTSITDGRFNRWTYDGTHFNQVGSRMLGMWYLKNIIGK